MSMERLNSCTLQHLKKKLENRFDRNQFYCVSIEPLLSSLCQWCIRAWIWPSVIPVWDKMESKMKATPSPSSVLQSCTAVFFLHGKYTRMFSVCIACTVCVCLKKIYVIWSNTWRNSEAKGWIRNDFNVLLDWPISSTITCSNLIFLQQWSVLSGRDVRSILDDQSLPLRVPESYVLLLLPRGGRRFVLILVNCQNII